MTEQRSTERRRPPAGDRPRGPSRRAVLAGAATIAAGSFAALGTSGARLGGNEGGATAGPSSSPGDGEPVSILAAGSLQLALSAGLERAVSVPIEVEAHGSVTAARLVAQGARDPDVVSLADTALFDSVLDAPWYATFATNAVVLAYDPATDGGARIADAGTDGWYRPLLDGTARLGRTDPDQDPLGYRTLFVLELASRYYDEPGLHERVPTRDQVYPETSLVSRLETGEVDAAFVYRSMAEERGYDYLELPDQVDLGSPDYVDDWYSTVSYTVPDGTTVSGGLISYGATLRTDRPAAVDVFRTHVAGEYLDDHGFGRPDGYPRYHGDVPGDLVD